MDLIYYLHILIESIVVFIEVALQKLWMIRIPDLSHIGDFPDRDGWVCIITGPTSGIGKETAREMFQRGYHVVLACRDINKGKNLKHEFIEGLKCSTSCQKRECSSRIEVMELDVSSFKSIRAFGAAWEKRKSPVHTLINNAGIFSMSAPRTETCDGFESHIGTNYLGHFLLTMLLQPSLLEAGRQIKKPARVVNVSSRLSLMGRIDTNDPNMKQRFNSLEAYAQSKLAQVIFAKELTNRMQGAIRCISLHPGEVLTDVVRSLPPILQSMYKSFMGIFLLTPSQGARSSVYAATSHDLDSQYLKDVFYLDSDCRPSKANPEVYSEKIAEWLWQWSCECTSL